MPNYEREEKILSILKQKKSASVHELGKQLYVSEATIRRDLIQMERKGRIRRTHGGAVLSNSLDNETDFYLRSQSYLKEKRLIAELAGNFIQTGYTLFLDSSSTSGEVISQLHRFQHLNVITNGLHNALQLSQQTDAAVYIAGGTVNNRSNSAVGADTLAYLQNHYADIAFISCNGIDINFGITDAVPEQSHIKQIMLKNAAVRILLCTSEKFGQIMMCKTAQLADFHYIITDRRPGEDFLMEEKKENFTFIYPQLLDSSF